jgi:hypothetical protein
MTPWTHHTFGMRAASLRTRPTPGRGAVPRRAPDDTPVRCHLTTNVAAGFPMIERKQGGESSNKETER